MILGDVFCADCDQVGDRVPLRSGTLLPCTLTPVLLHSCQPVFKDGLYFLIFSVRAKYHKLKYGTELNQGDMKPPSYDSGKQLEERKHVSCLMPRRDETHHCLAAFWLFAS